MSENAETVATFLRLLEDRNIDDWMELWADEGAQYYPFGNEMFPRHLVGKAAIYDRWRNMPSNFYRLSFPIRELWEDGDTVLARFDSESVLANGSKYENNYLGIFKFDQNGRVREYWEYFDPIIAGVEFGIAAVAYAPKPR